MPLRTIIRRSLIDIGISGWFSDAISRGGASSLFGSRLESDSTPCSRVCSSLSCFFRLESATESVGWSLRGRSIRPMSHRLQEHAKTSVAVVVIVRTMGGRLRNPRSSLVVDLLIA